MISRIIAYFNKDLIEKNEVILSELKRGLRLVKLERDELLDKVNATKSVQIIKADHQDPAPTDEGARAAYMANFSRLHVDFLKPKLYHMIADVREELDWSGQPDDRHPNPLLGMNRAEYDAYLRGTSNAFRLLLEYGEQCVSEDEDYKRRNKTN